MNDTTQYWIKHHTAAVATFTQMAEVARANEQHNSAEFMETLAITHTKLVEVLKLAGNNTAYNELKARANKLSWELFHALECV